jgi:hypothetical protein
MDIADSDIEANERLGEAELRALQLERLRASLAHAYANNPAYARKFDEAGVNPEDVKSLADLARFPFTTKADLRDNYPFGFFAVPMERIARIHASSGTTGKPTVVAYTKDDIARWSALVARSIKAAGGRPGMKVHVAYGYGLFTGGLGAHYGAELLGCTVIPMSGGQTERQIDLILDFEPDIIMVTPSYMLSLIDELRRRGIDPASTRRSAFSAPNRGRRQCAARSRRRWKSTPWTFMACRRSWGRASRRNMQRLRTGRPSGKIISIRRLSTRRAASRFTTASSASSCSHRSPRKRCRWFDTGPAT